ncbi:hypothetical protein H4219_004184 [Mycoemilia scoparia]|uniref:Uncharacterized protein n=1 Tax=Mycoemilia scoparia TaxID=417184 RepID=A0A9W8DS91_9FUNG|nr:hypothetical protein H4219_004184 [Mycoemilia scoparia]
MEHTSIYSQNTHITDNNNNNNGGEYGYCHPAGLDEIAHILTIQENGDIMKLHALSRKLDGDESAIGLCPSLSMVPLLGGIASSVVSIHYAHKLQRFAKKFNIKIPKEIYYKLGKPSGISLVPLVGPYAVKAAMPNKQSWDIFAKYLINHANATAAATGVNSNSSGDLMVGGVKQIMNNNNTLAARNMMMRNSFGFAQPSRNDGLVRNQRSVEDSGRVGAGGSQAHEEEEYYYNSENRDNNSQEHEYYEQEQQARLDNSDGADVLEDQPKQPVDKKRKSIRNIGRKSLQLFNRSSGHRKSMAKLQQQHRDSTYYPSISPADVTLSEDLEEFRRSGWNIDLDYEYTPGYLSTDNNSGDNNGAQHHGISTAQLQPYRVENATSTLLSDTTEGEGTSSSVIAYYKEKGYSTAINDLIGNYSYNSLGADNGMPKHENVDQDRDAPMVIKHSRVNSNSSSFTVATNGSISGRGSATRDSVLVYRERLSNNNLGNSSSGKSQLQRRKGLLDLKNQRTIEFAADASSKLSNINNGGGSGIRGFRESKQKSNTSGINTSTSTMGEIQVYYDYHNEKPSSSTPPLAISQNPKDTNNSNRNVECRRESSISSSSTLASSSNTTLIDHYRHRSLHNKPHQRQQTNGDDMGDSVLPSVSSSSTLNNLNTAAIIENDDNNCRDSIGSQFIKSLEEYKRNSESKTNCSSTASTKKRINRGSSFLKKEGIVVNVDSLKYTLNGNEINSFRKPTHAQLLMHGKNNNHSNDNISE